jgi:ribosome-associated protein
MDALRIDHRITLPAADLVWTAVRASGPGGQNVNKVASKVDLRFDLEGTRALPPDVKARLRAIAGTKITVDGWLVVTSQVTRDQARNLADAREKLRGLILQATVVPKKRRKTKPHKGAREERLRTKKAQGRKKEDRRKGWD